jgi:uncharacterized membrane protein YkvA (DUF1232 family)
MAARRETYALYLCCRDPRVPWYAKALAAAILAYALSPIDLIPDFVPVLGYADDLVIIPAGLLALRRMIPSQVLAEHREAAAALPGGRRAGWIAAGVVLAVWLAGLAIVALLVVRWT